MAPLTAPAALPPESTLPPILLPSAVVPSVALSGPDLLSGCMVAERVLEFEGPAGAVVERRHHIILCFFIIIGVRALGDEAARTRSEPASS